MGMSSSQARLLNLTARMHQIEYKAAKVEAQKLQMANESRRVYDNYLNALEAHKIQYQFINANGSIGYKDATLKALENGIVDTYNGETSGTTVYLQNMESGRIMLTSEVADKLGITGVTEERTLEQFLIDQGLQKTKVVSFNKVDNKVNRYPEHISIHNVNPITNLEGVVDEAKLPDFASFSTTGTSDFPTQSTSGVESVPASGIDLNGTYKVSSEQELFNLATTNGFTGTILLADNITMTRNDWSGIQNFKGTFNGNGHTISNLSGTQGLFATTENATIVNVGLENVNINGNSAFVGGLIGKMVTTGTSSSESVVSNCYTKGSVKNNNVTAITYGSSSITGTGGLIGHVNVGESSTVTIDNVYSRTNVEGNDGVGGVFGTTTENWKRCEFNISNIYATGNVSGRNAVGGFAGFMYNDQDNHNTVGYGEEGAIYTGMSNIYAAGNVTSTGEKSGGLIGCYLYYGDYEDYCRIYNANATGKVNGNTESSSFVGTLQMKNYKASSPYYLVHFEECGFIKENVDDQPFGTIVSVGTPSGALDDEEVERFKNAASSGEGFENLITPNSCPSFNDLGVNIMAALSKTDRVDFDYCKATNAEKTAMATKIAAFLSAVSPADNTPNNEKLYFLNEELCKYLNGTVSDDQIAVDLFNDIDGGSINNTRSYYNGKSLNGINVVRGNGTSTFESIVSERHSDYDGRLTVPSKADLTEQLYATFYLSHQKIEKSVISDWVDQYGANAQDLYSLASINEYIKNNDTTNLSAVHNAITSSTKANFSCSDYDTLDWQFSQSGDVTPNLISYDWDYEDPTIAAAVAAWTLAVRGVDVVDDDLALSNEWLTNMVETGQAILTDMNPDKLSEMGLLPVDDLLNMSDEEYNAFLEVINTSVATNTSLQEVQNEVELKKVEAQYEADMKRIDLKDRRYDTELAALDTERNAIKQEIETLKSVAKDNVERTFKLFG